MTVRVFYIATHACCPRRPSRDLLSSPLFEAAAALAPLTRVRPPTGPHSLWTTLTAVALSRCTNGFSLLPFADRDTILGQEAA